MALKLDLKSEMMVTPLQLLMGASLTDQELMLDGCEVEEVLLHLMCEHSEPMAIIKMTTPILKLVLQFEVMGLRQEMKSVMTRTL